MKNFDFKEKFGNTPVTSGLRVYLIPKNIQNREELNEYELNSITKGQIWLSKTKEDYLKYDFWLKLHKKMYSDVWRFAGQPREVELNNPMFKPPYEIRPELLKLEKDLKFLLDSNWEKHQEILAVFHERLLTIHPFLDGNGRWSRLLAEYLASTQNFPLPTWGSKFKGRAEKRRQTYIEALDNFRVSKSRKSLIEFMFS